MSEAQILSKLEIQNQFFQDNLKKLTEIADRHDVRLNSLEKTRTFQRGMLKAGTITIGIVGGMGAFFMWVIQSV